MSWMTSHFFKFPAGFLLLYFVAVRAHASERKCVCVCVCVFVCVCERKRERERERVLSHHHFESGGGRIHILLVRMSFFLLCDKT